MGMMSCHHALSSNPTGPVDLGHEQEDSVIQVWIKCPLFGKLHITKVSSDMTVMQVCQRIFPEIPVDQMCFSVAKDGNGNSGWLH